MSSRLFRKYINNNEKLECQQTLNKIMILGLTTMTILGSCVIITDNSKSCIISKNVKQKIKYPAFKPISSNIINLNTQNNHN